MEDVYVPFVLEMTADDIGCEIPDDCQHCGVALNGVTCLVDNAYYCRTCCEETLQVIAREAVEYARENVKITREIKRYDDWVESPEVVRMYKSGRLRTLWGDSHMWYLRHKCTNFDDLNRSLMEGEIESEIMHHVILDRVQTLIDCELLELGEDAQKLATFDSRQHCDDGS